MCKVVDLDGPVFLKADRRRHGRVRQWTISCPPAHVGMSNTRPSLMFFAKF